MSQKYQQAVGQTATGRKPQKAGRHRSIGQRILRGFYVLLGILAAIVVLVVVIFGGDEPAAEFQVISRQDISNAALERPLSSYTTAEIAALPTAKREITNAIITGDITQAQIEPTLEAILKLIQEADPDLDEITVRLFSEERRIGEQSWDIGSLLWAPGGELGNITGAIASSNNRSTYRTAVESHDDVEAYLQNRTETSVRHGMSSDDRRDYYRANWDLEGDMIREADAQISPLDDIDGNLDLYDELLAAGRVQLQERYGVSPEVHTSILEEGFEKGW